MDEQKQQSIRPPIDATRRRLTQVGLTVPVVLATLASKNALATAPYNCTISGKLSGNVSSHGQPVSCAIGKSHGYWKNHSNAWNCSPITPSDLFSKSPIPGFHDQYPSKTMQQVLELQGGASGQPYEALGREAVCAYLNAYKYGTQFPLSPQEVVSIFNTTVTDNGYRLTPGGPLLSPEWVKDYFESLHDS